MAPLRQGAPSRVSAAHVVTGWPPPPDGWLAVGRTVTVALGVRRVVGRPTC